MSYTIINNNNITHLKTLEDNTIDAIITDPPYGIEFLGKDWDSNTGAVETWEQCLRVLKPGGYLLAFSAARTYHILATNIQQVGFEIRDQLMWLYASGFPKAQDIGKAIQRRQGVEQTEEYKHNHPRVGGDGDGSAWQQNNIRGTTIPTSPQAKQWAGWKTALKPSHEPIVMARKPFRGSTIDNVLKHGTGALNIDATRIPYESAYDEKHQQDIIDGQENATNGTNFFGTKRSIPNKPQGGANGFSRLEFGEKEPAKYKDQKPNGSGKKNDDGTYTRHSGKEFGQGMMPTAEYIPNTQGRFPSNVIGEVAEGYQKYFYCPKVSRRERHTGFEQTNITHPDFSRKRDENGKPVYGESSWMYDPGGVDKIQKATKKDPLAHLGRQNHNDGWHCEDANRKKDPLAHIPAPIGDVKGAYVDGERMAAVHQKLQGDYTQTGTLGRMKDSYEQSTKNETHNINVMGKTPMCLDCNLTFNGTNDHSKCDPKNKTFVEKRQPTMVGNNHPTVKPVALMRYLIKLVTPPNSKVLDPFCGSGSTGMAAVELGHEFIGIELDANYCDIASRRIEGWNRLRETGNTFNDLFEEQHNG